MSLHHHDSRSPIMVNAVDFAADKDAYPAVTPLVSVGQQEGDEQGQTCRHTHSADGKMAALQRGCRASTVQFLGKKKLYW